MEIPIKMDDLGGKNPYFRKHPYQQTEPWTWKNSGGWTNFSWKHMRPRQIETAAPSNLV